MNAEIQKDRLIAAAQHVMANQAAAIDRRDAVIASIYVERMAGIADATEAVYGISSPVTVEVFRMHEEASKRYVQLRY
ncbi:hypothetical protein [Salinisphaera sp.]|uniref:hypothetical protein n=1 Tax=Salinisphaera sp. TaxID=1914330 RepID=UPI000C35A7CC|nr:hypothetical protein [Salinisphaera sp.]MAS10522.1 hypothetical protein [Salinisphaera sp.]|tara:strand:- start:7308 stop:7541 length:234 start_codon:yes stop_codon:yes gene_type:complete